MAYTKLFNSIITSTIWSEDDKTRIVWITMLAIADKNGEVQGSIPGLARIAGVSIEATRIAIRKFLSPDPDSRTKDDGGRRIEEIEGGWFLINHRKYREMASKEEAKEAEAKRKARYRARVARNGKLSQSVPDKSQEVPTCRHIADSDTHPDTNPNSDTNPQPEIRSDTHTRGEIRPSLDDVVGAASMQAIPRDIAETFWHHFESSGWIDKNGHPIARWQSKLVMWWRNEQAKRMQNRKGEAKEIQEEIKVRIL
jgi:hypothetical protein